MSFFTHNQIKEAGNYFLTLGNNNIKGLSFNYNRKESDLSFYNLDEIKKLLKQNDLKKFSMLDNPNKNLTELISEYNQGKRLWKWFVIATLLFLFAEVVLLRFMK